ncbi:phosphotransferase family protein [Saccharopolyspora sp. ASAGF58]|uniref:phosphotransferase family protein n=1 Tax=Saccharopolyspora sp. ASAGF58 TaxID=2719023 RepID=UPI0014400CC9|nr:phosphotransferase family protein [Saccharopolyspora sp. ASAGF58]QIZ37989.1 phosphotransferase family protein [Saccharopolyspora sp. ASAGF58]
MSDPTVAAVAAYLQQELGSAVRYVGRAPGNSHDGLIFERAGAAGGKVLARLDPADGPFLQYDPVGEELLIKQLAVAGLPVPRALARAGADVCGTSFLVLDWIEGDVVSPRETSRLPDTERRRLAGEMVDTLTRIHSVSPDDVAALPRPDGPGPESLLTEFDRTLDAVSVDTLALDYARVWMQQHVAELTGEVALVHGDFRLGNVVWEADRITGVLDWETARLGNPLFDVGWMCMGTRRGTDPVMGLLTRDEFLALYRERSGREITGRSLALWQLVATWVRGCTELRLLNLALRTDATAVDPRDLSWRFGRHRTEAELLSLIQEVEDDD